MILMQLLWRPWRMNYIAGALAGGEGCFLCEAQAAREDEARFLVARGKRSFVILNIYPYNTGHLMVAPYRHVAELEKLDEEEGQDLFHWVVRAVAALKRAMSPHGFNVGMNLGAAAGAGLPGHLHIHVVPRWTGDTNFMPILGETKVLPELLQDTYERLAPLLKGEADSLEGEGGEPWP